MKVTRTHINGSTMERATPESTAMLLGSLAHANRIRILERLSRESYCQCELGPALGIEQSNLSRHLKVLTSAGVVSLSREGNRINLAITDREVLALIHLAEALALRRAEETVVEGANEKTS